MGLLSATTSLTRFKVDGKLEEPILETIASGLKQNTIADIDDNPSEQAVGWTSFKDPFNSNFNGSNFMVGIYIVFALRIDRKSIPSKMVQKHFALASARKLKDLGRDFLSANEKRAIKDSVLNTLNLKIPATPHVFDVIWQYEKGELWFLSNLKSANEALETLFIKSFGARLVRCIPYTMAALDKKISASQLDMLTKLSADAQST